MFLKFSLDFDIKTNKKEVKENNFIFNSSHERDSVDFTFILMVVQNFMEKKKSVADL